MLIDLYVSGISHKTSTLALRERLTIAPEKQADFLQAFKAATGATEAVVLMTCNRSEWFFIGAEPTQVSDWLRHYFQFSDAEWQAAYYTYQQQQAVCHLMKVASGLDSMVIGEPQILGQMKAAMQQATTAACAGKQMQHIFSTVFAAAKKVRTQTAIGAKPASVAYAAVSLAKCIFNELSSVRILLIGAGDTTEKLLKHFQKAGVTDFIVMNRTLKHAIELAETCQGKAVELSELTAYLPQADVIVAATSSTELLITKQDMLDAARARRRPTHLIDLAVPRNIDAAVSAIDGVYLYNLDDLQTMVEKNKEDRSHFVTLAQRIIDEELVAFSKHQQIRRAAPLISTYRNKMEKIRDEELEKALRLLAAGAPADEVLGRFAQDLTKKLLHEPTKVLRSSSHHPLNDAMNYIKRFFSLEIA